MTRDISSLKLWRLIPEAKPKWRGKFWLRRPNWGIISAILLLILIAASWALWTNWARDLLLPRKWAEIEHGKVYRSGQLSGRLIRETLTNNHIGLVVSLVFEPGNDDPDLHIEQQICKDLGIERVNVPMPGDGIASAEKYAAAVTAIVAAKKANKPVLVHCASGAQRTGAVFFFYRLLVRGDSATKVLDEMVLLGHNPYHNPKLINYLNQQIPEVARLLVQRGILANIPDPMPQVIP